jgi:hypothetical protein
VPSVEDVIRREPPWNETFAGRHVAPGTPGQPGFVRTTQPCDSSWARLEYEKSSKRTRCGVEPLDAADEKPSATSKTKPAMRLRLEGDFNMLQLAWTR